MEDITKKLKTIMASKTNQRVIYTHSKGKPVKLFVDDLSVK